MRIAVTLGIVSVYNALDHGVVNKCEQGVEQSNKDDRSIVETSGQNVSPSSLHTHQHDYDANHVAKTPNLGATLHGAAEWTGSTALFRVE